MPETALVYLSLGSNLGDRAANLDHAIAALAGAQLRVLRRSFIYETEPVDVVDQPWFLNLVVEAESPLAPLAPLTLLRELQAIERRMGRERTTPRGPRVIDLDILLYGAHVIASPELEIPHPRMASRRFVLVPLAELAPKLRHPSRGATILELLAATRDASRVNLWTPGRAPRGI